MLEEGGEGVRWIWILLLIYGVGAILMVGFMFFAYIATRTYLYTRAHWYDWILIGVCWPYLLIAGVLGAFKR